MPKGMIKFTTVHKGQVRVLPDLTSQAGRGTSGVKKRSCARHGTLSRTLDLTQPDQPQPRVRSLRYHRRSLQTVLPSHRRRRTSRLQIPSFQSLAQCHFQLRAYERTGPVHDSAKPRTVCASCDTNVTTRSGISTLSRSKIRRGSQM